MSCKLFNIIILMTIISVFAPILSHSNEVYTEVIIIVKNDKILAFSAYKNHWVAESIDLSEKVIIKKSEGNIGIVATTKRLLGFSVITDKWNTEDLRMNERLEEVNVEGNVATIKTNKRVIGFNAHTGQWIEAP